MRAANMLARAIVVAQQAGEATTATLWSYASDYQRSRGALCAAQEWTRRLSESFAPADLEALFSTSAFNPDIARQNLGCFEQSLGMTDIVHMSRLFVNHPGLGWRLIRAARRILATQSHYANYPKTWDSEAFALWRMRTRQMFGR